MGRYIGGGHDKSAPTAVLVNLFIGIIGDGRDNADKQNNAAIRRRTIYWRTADVSALGGFHDIHITLLITIIGPYGWLIGLFRVILIDICYTTL